MSHILVVDDDEFVRTLVIRILESQGHIMSGANGGQEALSFLKGQHTDLILTDIKMPDIDGYALCREVRAYYPDMPCIAMSGHLYEDDAYNIPFDAFLKKPFDVEELIQITEQVLQGQPV